MRYYEDEEQSNRERSSENVEKPIDEDLIDETFFDPDPEDLRIEDEKPLPEPNHKSKRSLVKTIAIIITLLLIFQTGAAFFSTYTLDAFDFLRTSYELSQDEDVQKMKESVVTINMESSKGTGFLISSDGLIVTNKHVIDNHPELGITVTLENGDLYKGEIVSKDPALDLAFLSIKGDDLPHLPMSDEQVEINEDVYVIGNPLSFIRIVNQGKVLKKGTEHNDPMIISAPIFKGNSGSPVLTHSGEVVGVVYATRRDSRYNEDRVGLAIPIESIKNSYPEK